MTVVLQRTTKTHEHVASHSEAEAEFMNFSPQCSQCMMHELTCSRSMLSA